MESCTSSTSTRCPRPEALSTNRVVRKARDDLFASASDGDWDMGWGGWELVTNEACSGVEGCNLWPVTGEGFSLSDFGVSFESLSEPLVLGVSSIKPTVFRYVAHLQAICIQALGSRPLTPFPHRETSIIVVIPSIPCLALSLQHQNATSLLSRSGGGGPPYSACRPCRAPRRLWHEQLRDSMPIRMRLCYPYNPRLPGVCWHDCRGASCGVSLLNLLWQ